MADFTPPTQDQLLAMEVCAGIADLARHDRFSAATPDVVGAIAEGYAAHVEQGWNTIAAPAEFGGQGLPFTLATNVIENLGAANMAFTLLPILTVGAIEALHHHGSADQKALYLPRLISGEWSGTMNLTEPQAGSDVGALRTTATPVTEGPHTGKYRIAGQKIFITWGEHELAGNIIHLVLARVPGAPEGSRGISLFIVPKYLVGPDGAPSAPGARNDLACVGLEHKLGVNASPTCVMSFGEHGECIGELVGRENEGLRAMFTMMNSARVNVGNQGVHIAERALQQALAYARERVQSPRAGSPDKAPVAIIEHPDVRRMLLRMRALTEGARALLYYNTGQIDRGTLGDEAAARRAELLVPLTKAWCTDAAMEVTSLNIQIHGGMGFIEETGAAQHFRDARIPPIYEGTNGIQAADLVTRKLGMEGGGVLFALMDEIERDADGGAALAALARTCARIGRWMANDATLDDKLAGSVPFCTMCAVAVAGWQLLRQTRAVASGMAPGLEATKPVVTRYFLEHIVPQAAGLEASAIGGAGLFYLLDAGQLAG